MKVELKLPQYFRMLELLALLAVIGLVVFTGISTKWIGFARFFGAYLGAFFPVIAFLETLALYSERFGRTSVVTKSTITVSSLWSLLMIFPIFFVITESPLRYQGFTSASLSRAFPDSFADLMIGSAVIVCAWLVPVGILSGFLKVLKRRREEGIQWALISWQIVLLVVIAWGLLFQKVVDSRVVSVGETYFSPVQIHFLWRTPDMAGPFLSFMLVPLFWSVLFFALRYSVKYFGVKSSLFGLSISLAVATALIFVPHVPVLPSKRFVDFFHYSGEYWYQLPHLVPLRIWVASLIVMGGTLCCAGLLWLLRREKSTVQSG